MDQIQLVEKDRIWGWIPLCATHPDVCSLEHFCCFSSWFSRNMSEGCSLNCLVCLKLCVGMRKPWTHTHPLTHPSVCVSLSCMCVSNLIHMLTIDTWRQSLPKRKPSYGNLSGVILHVCLVRLSCNHRCNHGTFSVEWSTSRLISVQDIWSVCADCSCHVSLWMYW